MSAWRSLVAAVTGLAFVSAQTQAVAQDAPATAKNTAASIAQQLQGTINSTVTDSTAPKNVGGYDSSQSLKEGEFIDKPDSLGGAGAVAAQSSSAFAIGTATLPVTADTRNLDVSAAKQIEADPSAYTGTSTSGSQGDCKTVAASVSTGTTYYDSCNIGSTEKDTSFACTVGWNDVVSTVNNYSCEKKTVWGINTQTDAAGVTTTSKTNVATVSSCAQLEALSYCSSKATSTTLNAESYGIAGNGAIYSPPQIQFPSYSVDTVTVDFGCSQPVAVSSVASPTYADWTSVNAQGVPSIGSLTVTANAKSTGSTATLVSSTIDETACQAQIGSITCPSGSSLQNGQCVSTVPATPNYSCPIGWLLTGTTCTLQQASNASVSGYTCPAGYVLNGVNCVSTQAAGVSGYTCPSGYTLNGTTCTMVLTQPARAASYSCPIGFTLSGTVCYKSDTQPANTSFICPTGYALSGTTCTLTSQAAAVVSYTCPSGWTMNGNVCQRQSSYNATVVYTCPSAWTLNGTTCSSSSTYAASLIYSCPAGWTVQGSSCIKNTSYAPTVNYSCPGGWALNGTQCNQSSNYPATVTYSCSSGWSLNGSTCSQVTTTAPTAVSSCPSGWTQSGASCVQSSSYSAAGSCSAGGVIASGTFECHVSDGSLKMMNIPFLNGMGPGPAVLGVATARASDCGSLASQSSCSLVSHATGSTTSVYGGSFGSGFHNVWQFSTTTFVYQCSTNGMAYGSGANSNYSVVTSSFAVPGTGLGCGAFAGSTCTAPGVSGAKFLSGVCTATNSQPLNTNYTCPLGAVLQNGQCVQNSSQTANAHYSCADGAAPINSICYVNSTQAATASYSCPQGGTFDGSQCQMSQSQAASASYSCPSGGTLTGTSCVITNSQPATSNSSCPQGGTLSGTTCNVTNLQAATAVYGCPQGSTLSGTMCLTTDNKPATPQYACPSNYQLQGTNCVLSESTNATPILACPDGYLLNGSTCTETLTLAATQRFACAEGYTLSGNSCISTVGASINGYSCPTGYSLSGTTCVVSTTQPATFAYNCPAGAVLSGTDCVTTSKPASSTGQTCQAPVETCTDSSPTARNVNGVSVTHSCWAWGRNYQCATLTPANDCASLESQSNCKFDHEECLDEGCYTKNEVYLCTSTASSGSSQATVCSGDIYCIDGSCTEVSREASPDFADALTAINAMGDSNTQFDRDTLTIFGGSATGCHKPLFGLVNCCAGKVSGALSFASGAAALALGGPTLIGLVTPFLALFLCGSEEMQLDVKDRMGLCHFVGEYCSQKALFVCLTKRKTYCCFQTKLARVIQEQGREQLNKGWGSPKNADCSGFTIDQFSQLDLSKMDFTEVYSDYTSAVSIPSSLKSATDIQAKIQAYYAQHGGK